ncbi:MULTISPECIES: TRAP transporter small permease [Sporosarcina]|uniref:TRAP transporter small permease n=1 Tax=Sporosarcina TaxID=1569 RepID=UPI00129B0EC3|nr:MULTISPECIES: TRAP transporter small permease [Sporosarcina]GKV66563.1 ABC transporter permease [Sporosarcina sp. NCCP-2331]GLB56840.1 ABC transporter permease [Sporosarcina sp. NCCP-2378]
MSSLQKVKYHFDRTVNFIALSMVLIMSVVVITQVFTRNVLNYTPRWSEEFSMLLLVWITFLGIAVGFREKLHIGVSVFVSLMPKPIQKATVWISKIIIIGVSFLFIYYGLQFTVLMGGSTMAGTGFPTSVLYASIPVCGFLMLIYGIELLFHDDIHTDLSDTPEEEV